MGNKNTERKKRQRQRRKLRKSKTQQYDRMLQLLDIKENQDFHSEDAFMGG
jgi:hypothetical protein